jgi:adenylate cyclase
VPDAADDHHDPAAPRSARLAAALRHADTSPGALRALRAAREILPGDARFGDELSTAEGRPAQVLARHLSELGERRDSAVREAGLTTLQVWQAISRRAGRGAGTTEVAILFTDLVGFSTWVLEAGDELALALLRELETVVAPAVTAEGGRIVKRLGDGHMAVFPDPACAVRAALEIQERLEGVDVGGHRPRLRCGVHVGRPRQVGGDFLGTDVNIAARLAEAASGGEVLVSDRVLAALGEHRFETRRRRWFRAKGAPRDLEAHAVRRRA